MTETSGGRIRHRETETCSVGSRRPTTNKKPDSSHHSRTSLGGVKKHQQVGEQGRGHRVAGECQRHRVGPVTAGDVVGGTQVRSEHCKEETDVDGCGRDGCFPRKIVEQLWEDWIGSFFQVHDDDNITGRSNPSIVHPFACRSWMRRVLRGQTSLISLLHGGHLYLVFYPCR